MIDVPGFAAIKRAIFAAAAHAQRAADFLHGMQAVDEADEEVAASCGGLALWVMKNSRPLVTDAQDKSDIEIDIRLSI
jgi:hypothetical protein